MLNYISVLAASDLLGLWIALAAIGGLVLGILVVVFIPFFKEKRAKVATDKILKDAEIQAEKIKMNAKIDAKAQVQELKNLADQDIKERKASVVEEEKKLDQREAGIDRRDQLLLTKETALDQAKANYEQRTADLAAKQAEVQAKLDAIINQLQTVAQMSVQEAHDELMKREEEKMTKEVSQYEKNRLDEIETECDNKAKDIISIAISKYSQDVTTEQTISTVTLPSEDMKGRIIGREGRNIKSLESLLGVDVIIDDTPEVITLSCFDPIRREIARQTLEALIKDGRIQPGRIEEIYAKCKAQLEEDVLRIGQDTVNKLGLTRFNRELLSYIGRLKYRTSYGQNALDHSVQVAILSGIMAAELGLDQTLAKRAGLLHDIGKSADFELEGSHVEVGSRLAKKFGENEVVINAIESHHGDVPPKFVISNLVQAADTLSAARPGARSETLENYVQRIEQLETVCKSFAGVANCYAMQSGREVRVMVVPDKVSDDDSFSLARQIKEKIEAEMTYPGQIKVQVIREVRAVEVAK
ncbi:MAG: ribonuclease Y [Bacilli bacterium]|jgi:ribonuclease Y|nr:ribonuclease Y [Bacilli bacterium]